MGILLMSCIPPEMEQEDGTSQNNSKSIAVFNENFESGNFSQNPWTLGGHANPTIQSSIKYNGTYASKLGTITHNQNSYFQIANINVQSGSTITFWYKVSSETNYDYFRFYINGSEVKRDSGVKDWTQYSYELSEGTYTFKWAYTKDGSVSSGSDTAWIDDIIIESPDNGGSTPVETGWEDGFESGNFSTIAWTTGGHVNPIVQSTTKRTGTYAAKFGTITHNQNSYFQIANVEAQGNNSSITFWYKVSSEDRYDFFNFYVNGTRLVHAAGNKDWTEYSYNLNAGTYTFKFEYTKDGSVSNGSDTAWVDDIVFITEGQAPVTYPEIEITGTLNFGTVELTQTASQTYTINNTGDGDLLLTGNPLVAISGTHASQFTVTTMPSATIVPASSSTFTIQFAPTSEGTKTATVSVANNDSDENPFTFNITGEGYEVPVIPTDDFEDGFESGDFSAYPYVLGGDANPLVQSTTKYTGTYAAKFGPINNSSSSYFQLNNIEVTGDSILKFWYKVSSEQNYDFFNFYVNGTRVLHESGNVEWAKYSQNISTGSYTFKWEYIKDSSVANGSDTAWVDDIMIISAANALPEIAVSGTADFGSIYEGNSIDKTYTISNIGEGTLNLTGNPIVAISGSSSFTVTQQPASSVAPGSTTTFIIRFNPTSAGNYSANVSIPNNDADENPFVFGITGEGIDQSSMQDGWLFMMYMDGDNNLNSALWGDVNEMEYALYRLPTDIRNKVHIIVLWDGNGTYSGGPAATYLYELAPDNMEDTSLDSNTIALDDGWFTNGAELDMGDGNNLTQLILYARNRYPNMQNEVLIMSNHGGGVKSSSLPDRYGWSDDTNGGHLYTDEIQQALINAGCQTNKLSILGMDACLMGVTEEAYEYRNLAEFFIASPETEQGDGWEFNHFLPQITATTTPEQLSTIIVQSYKANFDANYNDQTLTAVRLSEMENLKTAIDYFAEKLYAENKATSLKSDISSTPAVTYTYQRFLSFYCDRIINNSTYSSTLKSAAQNVKTAMGNAIVYAWADTKHGGGYYGPGSTVKNGLLIVTANYSWYTSSPYLDHGRLDFCTTTNDGVVNTWKELMAAWY
jgi:hypothetical protein